MFKHLVGNELIQAYLKKACQENRLPQTLLFAGPEGVGKSLFARAVASHLLQSDRSPDLHLLKPEGKTGLYAIDTLREMIETDHAAPFEGSGKVFILEDAERMQPASANALLKTLEEPSVDATFILLSSAPQEILPTIRSRCVTLSFQPLAEESIATLLQQKGYPAALAKWAHGSVGRAFALAEHPELEEQRKRLFQILAEHPSYPSLSLQLEQLEELIEEGKEEDPVRAARRVEQLFAYILMWDRDQHLREVGAPSEFLFFPTESGKSAGSLKGVQQRVEEARLAYHRNMKLSSCLKLAVGG